jgi:hypothetical protein
VLSSRQKNGFLLLLAAMVLLLQSFAVWHDAEHPFHHEQAQCERLNAITHLPGFDWVAEIHVSTELQVVSIEPTHATVSLPATRLQSYFIRGPPLTS